MITIGISKWPTESGTEMGKRSLDTKPPPEFIQVIGPYMFPDDNEGIVAIAIFKYDRAKAGDAAEAIAGVYMPCLGVPGYTYSTRLASGAETTMKMMGLG